MKMMKKYFVMLLILCFVVAALYSYFILGNQARASRGITKGKEYAVKMYSDYAVVGESCQGEDSDNNGYISCNFRLKKNNTSEEKAIALQCPTFIKSFLATNCKEQGILINNQ